jgi:hypothetical protein
MKESMVSADIYAPASLTGAVIGHEEPREPTRLTGSGWSSTVFRETNDDDGGGLPAWGAQDDLFKPAILHKSYGAPYLTTI